MFIDLGFFLFRYKIHVSRLFLLFYVSESMNLWRLQDYNSILRRLSDPSRLEHRVQRYNMIARV